MSPGCCEHTQGPLAKTWLREEESDAVSKIQEVLRFADSEHIYEGAFILFFRDLLANGSERRGV